MDEAVNRGPECPQHLMRGGTLSPGFIEYLKVKLDQGIHTDGNYNWKGLACKLMPDFRRIDLDAILADATCSSQSPVELMLKKYAQRGEMKGYELWEAVCAIGRLDILQDMEQFGSKGEVFVDPDIPPDYERIRKTTAVSQPVPDETSVSKDTHVLPNCELRRAPEMPQMDCKQSNKAAAAVQMEYQHPLGATASIRSDPREDSYYTEEMRSETTFLDNHYFPQPPFHFSPQKLRYMMNGKKKNRFPSSRSPTTSTMSSDDGSVRSIPVDENSQFEDFKGVVRGCQNGSRSLENWASSRVGSPSVLGDDVEKNTVVGISFAEQDRSVAEKLAYHLECYGCQAVFISKEHIAILHKMNVILVIYSYHYKEQNRPAVFRKSCIRAVFEVLQKEYARKRRNQRCIFYPTFQVSAGQKLPAMFHDFCPRESKARQVFEVLFRKTNHRRV